MVDFSSLRCAIVRFTSFRPRVSARIVPPNVRFVMCCLSQQFAQCRHCECTVDMASWESTPRVDTQPSDVRSGFGGLLPYVDEQCTPDPCGVSFSWLSRLCHFHKLCARRKLRESASTASLGCLHGTCSPMLRCYLIKECGSRPLLSGRSRTTLTCTEVVVPDARLRRC